jgi:hypothetical protein
MVIGEIPEEPIVGLKFILWPRDGEHVLSWHTKAVEYVLLNIVPFD